MGNSTACGGMKSRFCSSNLLQKMPPVKWSKSLGSVDDLQQAATLLAGSAFALEVWPLWPFFGSASSFLPLPDFKHFFFFCHTNDFLRSWKDISQTLKETSKSYVGAFFQQLLIEVETLECIAYN